MKKIFLALVLNFAGNIGYTQTLYLSAPAGSVAFGTSVVVLTNGNFVVTDPQWQNGTNLDVGAVYLYNGQTNDLISTLTGSHQNDAVGFYGVTPLSNGNFVVNSPYWRNSSANYLGAVTWVNGLTGLNGIVSNTNSLTCVGQVSNLGATRVVALPNGCYVVHNHGWDTGAVVQTGAVTWGNGTSGISGVVSSGNSLVGTKSFDLIGSGTVEVLSNGNYVVRSPQWRNGALANAGAATWGSGITGITGGVSSNNSLTGTQAYDEVGEYPITVLNNGNYVVGSYNWKNGSAAQAGAVTWGNGATGVTGAVSSSNSLVGSQANDKVGYGGITALSNGNYVVSSYNWRNGSAAQAGAVTWGSGTGGISGVVSNSNSLTGSQANDVVGIGGVTALSNGNYVVNSYNWKNGSIYIAGAATWGNGAIGVTGLVTSTNSLVGVGGVGGGGIVALNNGNYVVNSPNWSYSAASGVGAVTWGNGVTGTSGTISNSNSLVGSQQFDYVGNSGVTALSNGNYVISSPQWKNGSVIGAGAITWGNGISGTIGSVSNINSLVGTQQSDSVGLGGIAALNNGNYVVSSPTWKNGSVAFAGAATWSNGTTGISGAVSNTNSLVGTQANDKVGSGGITKLTNSNYVVSSPQWKNGSVTGAGAATWSPGFNGITGSISTTNSLVGMNYDYVSNSGITALNNGNYIVHTPDWGTGPQIFAGAATLGNGTTGTFGFIKACNSALGITAYGRSGAIAKYNAVTEKVIVVVAGLNQVSVFSPSQSTLTSYSTIAVNSTFNSTSVSFVDDSCKLITTLKPAGNNQITGEITASVFVQSTAPTTLIGEAYVRRHYAILPADSADFKTARVTLYFTQADFDDYNTAPGVVDKLPTNPNDAGGKALLRVTQQRGTSATGNFGTFTGFASSGSANVLVIPGNSNVVWNGALARWEVTFPVTGFGGFFLSAGNDSPLSLPAKIHNVSGITVSPVPTTHTLTLTSSNSALAGSTVTALNLQGQVMATVVLDASTQMDVQHWPAGIYLLKFVDGSVVKVVKQ